MSESRPQESMKETLPSSPQQDDANPQDDAVVEEEDEDELPPTGPGGDDDRNPGLESVDSMLSVQMALGGTSHIRKWKESPWAVGFTIPTWREEPTCNKDMCSPLCLSACCCWWTARVGNMVVLAKTKDRLLCIMGPYWMVLLFVTLPALAAFSCFVAYKKLGEEHVGVVVAWSICTGLMFSALLLTGCRDPGILRRTRQISDNSSWRWNDQALTYRPSSAKYDPECACVIAEFDHTCPWTGTAIGKNNMFTFKMFLGFLLASIMFNVVLIVLL